MPPERMKRSEIKQKLKPCPFCGGKAVLEEQDMHVLPFLVKCGNDKCLVYAATYNKFTKKEAIEAWNRRVEQ